MQTDADTERIVEALTWQSVKLPNGVYRVQNVTRLDTLPDADALSGFKNCTECGVFVDQLECVRDALGIQEHGLWIGLVNRQPDNPCAKVTTLLWSLD